MSGNIDVGRAGLIASKLAPTVFGVTLALAYNPIPLWERACSRWRHDRQHQCWMCRPHREQARSHSFFVVNLALAYNPIPLVGASLLAMAAW